MGLCLNRPKFLSITRRRHEISDEQHNRIEPLLSGKPGDPGRNAENNRRFISAVVWIARTGSPWPDLPERFGKYDTVYHRFNNWAKKGRWKTLFESLQEPDLDWVMIDSSVVRAHQHAAGQKEAQPKPRPSGEVEAGTLQRSTSSATRSVIH